MAAPSLGQVTASVFEKVAGAGPEDNVFTSQALLYLLKRGKGFRALDGGRLIEEDIEYAENTTFRSYSDLETLDTTRIDVFDAARYDWKEVGGTVVYSNLEKLRAQGSSAKFDLIAAKVNNAKQSMFAVLNRQFYGDGTANGGKDIGGLGLLVPTTTTSGSPGGINRATFTFWRSRSNSGAGTAFSILRASMRTTYNECSKGAQDEQPEWIVFDSTSFAGYESTLVSNERFTSQTKTGKVDGGFRNDMLQFKGADVTFDEDCPAATGFVGNSRNLKFNYPRGGWAKAFAPVEPANQTAEVVKIATVGNMSMNNPRRLGKIYSIA
jgi:hypothetical protein